MSDPAARPPSDPRSFHVPERSPPAERRPPARAPGSRRPRARTIVAAAAGVVLLALLLTVVVAWWLWRSVERVDLGDALGGGGDGTNYLLVGTDSRDGLDADVANSEVIFGDGVAGERTDTIAILHLGGDGDRLLAVPRDLYVPIDGGSPSRVNSAFRLGPEALVRTVGDALHIPVHHYLEVDLAGFLGLVDALGGVTIRFEHPARDSRSGLQIPEAGAVELDSAQALAYVRSRHYVETIDGAEVRDPTADLGRVQRQQRFLGAVFDELGDTYNPITMLRVLDGVRGNVRVDDGLGFLDAVRLGSRLRGLAPLTDTVPTRPATTPGGAAVLLLDEAAAEPLLEAFR
ncbi:MAG: LCP family protein [Acidimicrobiales bacterium]